jgi:hypothetical protein
LGNDIRQVVNRLAYNIFAARTQYHIGKGLVAINKDAVWIPEKGRVGNCIYQGRQNPFKILQCYQTFSHLIHFIVQPTDEIMTFYGFICGGGRKTRTAGNSNWYYLSAKNRLMTFFLSA